MRSSPPAGGRLPARHPGGADRQHRAGGQRHVGVAVIQPDADVLGVKQAFIITEY